MRLVILALILLVFGIPALIGYHLAAPRITMQLDSGLTAAFVMCSLVGLIAYAFFRKRKDTHGVVPIKVWYSFEHPLILAFGAVLAFTGGTLVGMLLPLPAIVAGSVGSSLIVRAVTNGPVYGWRVFFANHAQK